MRRTYSPRSVDSFLQKSTQYISALTGTLMLSSFKARNVKFEAQKERPGSALLFVLMIVAGVVTVVVGTQRLALVQYNQAVREEDNMYAYHAAKAGVEDALMRFRYERDVETEKGKVFRFNLSNGESMGEVGEGKISENNPNYDPASQYYDLSINFKTNKIGDFSFGPDSPLLKRDAELQLTGFPNSSTYPSDYYLRYAFKFEGSNCLAENAFVQIQYVRVSPTGSTSHDQSRAERISSDLTGVYDSAKKSLNYKIRLPDQSTTLVRIRPYICDVRYAFITADTPSSESGGPEFDSLQTTATATGYFGKAKRTLQAVIDRKSGTLLSIYDFNIYAGQGSIEPR